MLSKEPHNGWGSLIMIKNIREIKHKEPLPLSGSLDSTYKYAFFILFYFIFSFSFASFLISFRYEKKKKRR